VINVFFYPGSTIRQEDPRESINLHHW